jgi:transposase
VSPKFRPYCHLNYVHSYRKHWSIWPGCFGIIFSEIKDKIKNPQRIYLTYFIKMYIIMLTNMARPNPTQRDDPKAAALRDQGALHPHPEAVKDEAFRSHEFFDPRDLVQVRYEMLRCHRVDGRPVTEVAGTFGVSRQAFYKMAWAFKTQGASGLLPRRRGPKRAHKCTDEILDFVQQWRSTQSAGVRQTVVQAVQSRFGVTINPRSIERALARRKKKRRTKREEKK